VPVVSENSSMNDTDPVLLSAALLTGAPRGRRIEMSVPTPPPRL
jgi:hypothetical protein